MDRLRRLRLDRHRLADAAVAGGVVLAAVSDLFWELPGAPAWQWAVAVALTAGVMLLRRRAPFTVMLATFALEVAVHTPASVDDPFFQFVAHVLAVYALGAHAPLRRGLAGLAVAIAAFSAFNLVRDGTVLSPVAGAIQFSVVFGFGQAIGRDASRRRALEAEAARARAAVADERARIARDLHDALGHTISAVTLQVGAVRRRLGPEQEAEREMLLHVERSGRESVGEMRRLIGILREPPAGNGLDPVPTLADADRLAEPLRAAGVEVDLRVEGAPRELPAGLGVAGYRIVQEALTNVLKHGAGSAATVRIAYEPSAVVLEITNPRSADGFGEAGHGLIGMRERVALYGGTLEAGPCEGGGFRVRARLPREGAGA